MPRLRAAVGDLPRNTTADYLRRLRRLERKRRRLRRHRVRWNEPATAWAMDGTWLDQPVVGNGRRALVVVDLHSKDTLAVASVPGERASAAERVLQALVEKHGAPLVLKLDNGSAFISERVAAFCERHGITRMHSPVRRPSWNGTCEVSGRWAKRRAEAAARLRGDGTLTQADLDCAVTCTGVLPKVDAELRQRFRRVVAQQLAMVAAERGLDIDADMSDHVRGSLGGVAARRALQECHLVTIEGREYPQCFSGSVA